MEILLILSLVLLLIIVAASKFNVHPFFILILAAILTGFLLGYDASEVIAKVTEGFGKTLSSIGIIIALGAVIGIFLEKSGGTRVMADVLLKTIGSGRSVLAMNFTGFIISIPVFCDSGFILLSSLIKALSRKTGISLLTFAVALSAGLYATHVFVPPTPGPLAAAAILGADIGRVMLFGLIVAIPVSLSGYFWARFIGKKTDVKAVEQQTDTDDVQRKISSFQAFAPIFIPIALIGLSSFAAYPTFPLGDGKFAAAIIFLGQPIIALFIGVILSLLPVIRLSGNKVAGWTSEALKDAGAIILITGAGGAFGNILRDSGIAELFSNDALLGSAGLFIIFFISALLKTAQGSSTVAILTTAAIVAPLLSMMGFDSENGKVLAVLAIGAGAMTVSHVNDSFFWVVAKFSDLDTKTALKGQTIGTLIQGLTGLLIIFLLQLILL